LIFETTSLSKVTEHIRRKFIDLLLVLEELQPFINQVLEESKRINMIRRKKSQISDLQEILKRVLRII